MVHDNEYPADPAVQLADCLEALGLRTKVIERISGPQRMRVSNPASAALSETIFIFNGAFWWPWKDKIGAADDVPGVADRIARVLAVR